MLVQVNQCHRVPVLNFQYGVGGGGGGGKKKKIPLGKGVFV
jgi:hypothetical protein